MERLRFRRNREEDLILGDSQEARGVAAKNRTSRAPQSKRPELVHQNAVAAVLTSGGNTADRQAVLGQYQVQFGVYRGQTFRWMLQDCLGYSAWLANGMKGEKATDAPLSKNKFAFREYITSYPEGEEAIRMKADEKQRKADATRRQPLQASSSQSSTIPPAVPSTTVATEMTDTELCSAASHAEAHMNAAFQQIVSEDKATSRGSTTTTTINQPCATTVTTTSTAIIKVATTSVPSMLQTLTASEHDFPLPDGWRISLPDVDHRWVAKALFKWSFAGNPELDQQRVDRLWWYPPQPMLAANQVPGLDRYFAHRLLVWMPRRLWHVKFVCPHPECREHELTAAGLYRHTRQVIDIDDSYNIATEYLECTSCKRKVISWSQVILRQLDLGHRSQFPAVLSYRLACDIRVIRLLRQRALGNSSTQLQRKLEEQHGEAWLQKSIQYMTDCAGFMKASSSGLITQPAIKEGPAPPTVPTYKWLLTVYSYDVLQRLDVVKASLTSTFGRVLKMDSTKKVVKKVAGDAAHTAAWATNVGNEHGQVLMSVLTACEGAGLGPMVQGLINRYKTARVDPPELLYVDRDCCGESAVSRHFAAWPDIEIRLDIWHFMRRFSAGVTTDAQ